MMSGQEGGIRADLCRLARFGANIADAHSCFIFLPHRFLAKDGVSAESQGGASDTLVLGGSHSFSPDVFKECSLQRGSGLIGWVAKHNRSIHVSPFERDSRTLGVYSVDQHLKSFIGIPIRLTGVGPTGDQPPIGVVACDSKKAFAFSKVQGKLLEDLAAEVAREVDLIERSGNEGGATVSWEVFYAQAEQLIHALGANAVEVLRVRQTNFAAMERALGTGQAMQIVEQTARLVQQALPPHFPFLRLPNGELLLVVDNMMTSFYEGKIRAICGHVGVGQRQKVSPEFDFVRSSARRKRGEISSLAGLIAETASVVAPVEGVVGSGEVYGYRRA